MRQPARVAAPARLRCGWRRRQPVAARLLDARSLPQAFGAGAVWGRLPCAVFYGTLGVAALAGGPGRGALAMFAFGSGTLPNLLGAGLAAARLRNWSANRMVRLAAGGVVFGFGVVGLVHAAGLVETIRRGLLWI